MFPIFAWDWGTVGQGLSYRNKVVHIIPYTIHFLLLPSIQVFHSTDMSTTQKLIKYQNQWKKGREGGSGLSKVKNSHNNKHAVTGQGKPFHCISDWNVFSSKTKPQTLVVLVLSTWTLCLSCFLFQAWIASLLLTILQNIPVIWKTLLRKWWIAELEHHCFWCNSTTGTYLIQYSIRLQETKLMSLCIVGQNDQIQFTTGQDDLHAAKPPTKHSDNIEESVKTLFLFVFFFLESLQDKLGMLPWHWQIQQLFCKFYDKSFTSGIIYIL